MFFGKKDNLTLCQDALNGDADSQFDLASWYMAEEKNSTEAFNWVRKSAAQGCAKSQYVAGLMYYDGEGTDTHWFYASELIGRAAKSGLLFCPKATCYCENGIRA
ncbi:Sel1 repeat-containing protein [Providencia sneebia DSM 19967]|uniref:Sel1 repeat-containing protein n=1 Tax=Providencia sneebia DSM 19967 TaxID=1141660 RepID=K8WCN5_9GAMM|nr:sel1 repeat family protein [Providencia sneebia]EKT58319.1 Sel1 repeat-containing protein [Providencia sneebia DSM 19967]